MSKFLISEHTISWLPQFGSTVLDVGCRHYDFASFMAKIGCEVFAIEPDILAPLPQNEKIHVLRTALVPESQAGTTQELIWFGNGTANHLKSICGDVPRDHNLQVTSSYSMSQICKHFNIDTWDVVKLDCEGSEYGVLLEWPGPVAKQITVEFHEHTGANVFGASIYNKIFDHLSQWYDVVQHELSIRHCLSTPNYWDTLLVLRGERNEL